MTGNEEYTIYVKTFGGFSIRYKGSELSFGNPSCSRTEGGQCSHCFELDALKSTCTSGIGHL